MKTKLDEKQKAKVISAIFRLKLNAIVNRQN